MNEVPFAVEQNVAVVSVFDLEEVGDDGISCSVFVEASLEGKTLEIPARDLAKLRCARANLAVEESPYVDWK